MQQREAPRALVLLADGAEEMEVTIAVDVLRRGGVEVVLAGLDGTRPVRCSRGIRILPDAALDTLQGVFDAVVLPGGLGGAEALAQSVEVGDLLRAQYAAQRWVAAICAAPIALVQHGIGAGVRMACHPSVAARVAGHGVLEDARVVKAPGLITSQGPGTAFEFALALVAELVDSPTAEALVGPMILRPS
ncbi:MAG: DJ-1/PfpI family protein [Planctomycetes bacterium]|nr:DJ-1/PfpI family protein [Planctomycetota bacterium]MCB9868380.1 DJ-1/PfpI family protein [Planctomycetota bacterium]MCB9889627.1 DJ-1/PfpI family protein [Planctomycetota bacterium]